MDIRVTNIEIEDNEIYFANYCIMGDSYIEIQNMWYSYPEVLEGIVLWL